jgi:hypothetical protein
VAATPEVTGVLVEGADATLEAVLVGGVSNYGVVGLNGSRITIQGSVISGGTLGGLLLEGTTAKVTRSSVRANGSPTSKHGYGVLARWQGKPAQLELQDSLVRKNANAGVVVLGSNAVVERTAVVETFEATDGQRGGYGVRLDREKGTAGKLELRDSLVAANQAIGLHVRGSEATVDRSVFRGTQLSAAGDDGYGVRVGASPQTGERGKLVLRDSLVNGNRTMGISLRGAEAVLERVVVQGTLPRTDGKGGLGVSAELPEELGAKAPATELTLRDCVVQDNHWAGILLEQATATLERVAVRDTRRDKGGESLGRGINAYGVNGTMKLTLKDSVVSGNADVGISLTDTAATMARVLVRDTEGYGVQIKSESASAAVDATDLAVSTSRGVGIIVGSVAGSISRSVVRNTRQLAGQLGDGVVVARASPSSAGSSVALTDMLVEESARAGMLFVASDGSVSGSVLRRGVFAIDLELGANPKIGDDNRFEDNKENKVTYGQSLTASPAPEIPSL